jgi:hypothetical protein
MKFVEAFGKQRGVWVEGTRGKWDGAMISFLTCAPKQQCKRETGETVMEPIIKGIGSQRSE